MIAIYENQKSSTPKKYVKKIEQKNTTPKNETENPPHELREIGLEILSQATKELKDLGIHRNSDNIILSDYAMQYQLYVFFQNKAMLTNSITFNAKGVEIVTPYAVIADKHFTNYLKIQQSLGLNPSARQKLTLKQKEDIDEMGDLF